MTVRELPYHENTYTYEGRLQSVFGVSFPPIRSGTILDAGCSVGHTTYELADRYTRCKIVGSDINPSVLPAASARRNVEFIVDDFYRSKQPTASFSGVFCMNNLGLVLSDMRQPQRREVLSHVGALVRLGGHLTIACECADYGLTYQFLVLQRTLLDDPAAGEHQFTPRLRVGSPSRHDRQLFKSIETVLCVR